MPFNTPRRKPRLAPRRKPGAQSATAEKAGTNKASATAGKRTPSSARKSPPQARRKPNPNPSPQNQAAVKTSNSQPAAKTDSPKTADRKPASQTRRNPTRRKKPAASQSKSPALRIIPLGGMREIGKNLTVYEYGNDMIMVDCGIAFPEEDMPGIDIVIPDFNYILKNKDKLRGIFLTHGHEDHIGALPWLLKDVKVPIYGNKLTIELARLKIEDRGTRVGNVSLNPISDGDVIQAGPFSVEFVHVNHSIADANAMAIRTPAGVIYHSGDFKIDYTPINGGPIDLARIAAIGAEGVLAMVCESTNVERTGFSTSESKVGETFADLFGKAQGRIFVATFSSNIFRMQQIFTAAEKYNRKVALIGRSMLNVFKAADSLGYLKMRKNTLIDINQIDRYEANEVVVITTGSQGEPMSALTRMAFSEHKRVEIVPEDTIIISATPIPGNEKPIYKVINELFKRGAHVIYESLSEIHVSGHAYSGELKLLHNLLKPRFFIPGHGEYRHLFKHAELAVQMGVPSENVFLLNNGDIFEYRDNKASLAGFTTAGGVLIDGSGMTDINNPVLRDRLLLSEEGVVTVFMAVDHKTGELIGRPDIQASGFIYEAESDKIIAECRKRIEQFAQKNSGNAKSLAEQVDSGALRDYLRNWLFQRTRRRPVTLISYIEI